MNSTQGWSLLELMMVLAIIAILSLAGTPGFNKQIKNSQSEKAARLILHSLKLAQQQAAIKQKTITVCPTINQQCSQTGAQELGIFFDDNENQLIDNDEQVLAFSSVASKPSHIRIKASFGRPYIRFSSTANAMESGSIFYCPEREDLFGQVITVNLAGRAYLIEDRAIMESRIDCP